MAMRTVFDPFGSPTLLVDKMIGNEYDIVKFVAENMEFIRHVQANLEALVELSNNLKTSGLLLGTTGLATETTSIALPDGVLQEHVLASSVLVVGKDGGLYGPDSGYFDVRIQGSALHVTMAPTAPLHVQNATIRWFLTYGV